MNTVKIHSLPKTFTLHLLPGVLGTLVYVLLAPILVRSGYPAILALLIAVSAVTLPLELGYLLMQRGKSDEGAVISLRDTLPRWQYIVLPLGMVVWGFLASGALAPLDLVVARAWFSWLPEWFFFFDVDQFKTFSREPLMTTFWIGLIVNGLLGPIVEEFYFRGYLLPRIPGPRNWSLVLNIALFSLYHFWTPWQFVSRILWILPWGYIVLRKNNFYLMMIAHCAGNTIGWILTWALILGTA